MGVPFGPPSEMHRGTIYNPGGYFERKDINDANDAYIASAGTTLADPDQTVYALAGFLGITDKRAIRRAINVVGKKKGLFLYQLHRYLVRAPRKAWRLLRKRCQGIF